jgi:signal transduction histidine kinase
MSLRAKFTVLFIGLAVLPLVGIGVFDYVRSTRAVRELVGRQVEEISAKSANDLKDSYSLIVSDLMLFAENAETQGMYAAYTSGDSARIAVARRRADAYLRDAWEVLGAPYRGIEFYNENGELLYRLTSLTDQFDNGLPGRQGIAQSRLLTLTQPIRKDESDVEVGVLSATVSPDAILPYESLETRFGGSGYSVVIDRSTGRVLYHPRHAYWQQSLARVSEESGWDIDPSQFERESGTLVYHENDTVRVASFVSLSSPPWTFLSSGSPREFGDPFLKMRAWNLALVASITLVVILVFSILSGRATRSLEVLAQAADEVGAGNYEPSLPKAGGDEVGRLSAAFRLMVGKIRETLEQIEQSRQMAAIGEFASQIAHEIRNPLTSLKLNLQGLDRDVRDGMISEDSSVPIDICLREVQRLDRVVGGVLTLARPHDENGTSFAAHEVLNECIDMLRAQFGETGILVSMDLRADSDMIQGNREDIKSAVLNLLLNAAQEMPSGGEIILASETVQTADGKNALSISIVDTGPGVSDEVRESIFRPFFSTKSEGTGLGLSVALRIAEAHGGTLHLAPAGKGQSGAVFVVVLPCASEDMS